MTKNLGVEVVCLKRGVVDMELGSLKEEEAVVVHELLAPVQPEEDSFVDALIIVDQLLSMVS